MSRVFSNKAQKEDLVKNAKQKLPTNCNLKLFYPPVESSEDNLMGKTQSFKNMEETNLNHSQNSFSKRNVNCQCHNEERKKLAEIKRKNFIQKLKNIYKINVENFNEDVISEIIMKVRLIEKEKRERKQRSRERTMIIVNRILKEQKSRIRETKAQCLPPKSLKIVDINEEVCSEVGKFEQLDSKPLKVIWEKCAESKRLQRKDFDTFTVSNEEKDEEEKAQETEKEEEGEEEEEEGEGKKIERPLTCLEILKSKKNNTPKIFTRKFPPCVSFEKYLECTPKRIVFKDYKKDKVYLQDMRITNIGSETIHCRYLGLLVHNKGEGKFPIGVAVRDNVRLRPGLSCSTKIRLCSPDDIDEMECSIVYETRRKQKCFEYSWFFVPVACLPARAVVKVTPMRMIFPAFTWCAATGSVNAEYLKKTLKIENTGGKGCSCRITDDTSKPVLDEMFYEWQGEEGSLSSFSAKNESEFSKDTEIFLRKTEFYGEEYNLGSEGDETATLLVNELIENVFATFRFSKKYCIEIPPFSVQYIEVRFIPKYKGFHHEMKYMEFEECYNLEEQSIELMGDIKQIPLQIEPQVIDLKTCIINSGVYAGIFKVFNCSKGPYTVRLKIPSSLQNHSHVHPRTAIIQPFSSCVFSVRIYPRITLRNDAPQYFDEDSGVLEFPIRVHPSNIGDCKLDYLKLYVHALITTFDLELSPSTINFGTVTTLETVRTKLELTNHSLAVQEFGFLNLPKGIRVEPNMGFGKILPMETISLYLIYSPTVEIFVNGSREKQVDFEVVITSITKHGGFGEKLNSGAEESFQEPEIMGEVFMYDPYGSTLETFNENQEVAPEQDESEESDICDEDFSTVGEELLSKLQRRENKIRKFLKSEDDEVYGNSLNKVNSQNEGRKKDSEGSREILSFHGEYEENGKFKEMIRPDMNVVKCRANVVGPRCQTSETVIQLPATPFNSYSLYRFQLSGTSESEGSACTCGLKSFGGKPKFKATFEFLCSSPQITLEPGSGFLKAGDSVPVTIISRPEPASGEPIQEVKIKKASDSRIKLSKRESIISKSNTGTKFNQRRNSEAGPKAGGRLEENATQSGILLKKSDLSLSDQFLQELTESFFFETKVRCVLKTLPCEEQMQMTEVHDLVLICPAIRRHLNHLSKSQEINFGKTFIGTQTQIILQVQNVSFSRISPSMTLLNPAGPFFCPGSFCKVDIDPEHIWKQPLTFLPKECKEVEQFFEIFFGPTSVLLKVAGEAVEPQYNIVPSFSCCLLEAKMGALEELKLEINNQSPATLFLRMETVFLREGFDLQIEGDVEVETASEIKTRSDRKEDLKEKKKSKNVENEKKKYRLWEATPEPIMNNLEDFKDSLSDGVFTLAGVNENNSFAVPPYEANQIKVQFWAPADKGDKKYAVKYKLILDKTILLKEVIILGRISK